jgi:hypothetical protein
LSRGHDGAAQPWWDLDRAGSGLQWLLITYAQYA